MIYDVFLSYARSELEKTKLIRQKLEGLGLKVFFDTEGIEGGDEFPDVINNALKQSGAIVSLWSPEALARLWVKRECRVGQMRGVLVPVMIEHVEPLDIPAEFVGMQYVDLIGYGGEDRHPGFALMLRALARTLKRDDLLALADRDPVAVEESAPEAPIDIGPDLGSSASAPPDIAPPPSPPQNEEADTFTRPPPPSADANWSVYEALGVRPSANDETIRRAYRKIAKVLHPDVRPNDPVAAEQFRRATAAFMLLSDPMARASFERGEIDKDGYSTKQPMFGKRKRLYDFGDTPSPFDLGDIFSDLFGVDASTARGFQRMRGRDIRFTLEIDFLDAVNGARRRVALAEGRTLDVAIPAGVETGQVLRLKNQGGSGVQGGPAGDALVELHVRPHPYFRREGQDVHMDLNISLTEAIFGAKVQTATVDGPVSLTIPPGSNTGKVMRLKGKGVGGQGDQFVRLLVVLPETNDKHLRNLVELWPGKDYKPPRPE